MRKAIITFSAIVLGNGLFGQFFGLSSSFDYFYATVMEQPKDGKFRVLQGNVISPSRSQRLLVFDQSKTLVDSVIYPGGIWLDERAQPVKFGNKYLLGGLKYDSINNIPASSSGIFEFDSAYKLVNYHKLTSFDTVYSEISGLMANSFHVFALLKKQSTTRWFKLASDFSKIDSSQLLSGIVTSANSRLIGSRIYTMIFGLPTCGPPSTFVTTVTDCAVFDTSLTMVNCFRTNNLDTVVCGNNVSSHVAVKIGYALSLTNNKIALLGNHMMSCSTSGGIYSMIVNSIVTEIANSKNIIKTNLFQQLGNKKSILYRLNSAYFSFNSPFLVTVGTSDIGEITWPIPWYDTKKSKVFVNKTDTSGNIIWEKRYGGEMNYYGRSIATRADGSYVIAGVRFDSTTMWNQAISENFLLHLDQNGNFLGTGIFSDGRLKWNTCRIYPNPVRDELRFDIPFESVATLEITDNTGKKVMDHQPYIPMQPVSVRALSPGLYLYRICGNTGVFTGKFIRE